MKKRLVALTLVAAMALGMTACGGKSESKISTNDTSANGTSHTSVSAGVDWTGYDELVESIRTESRSCKACRDDAPGRGYDYGYMVCYSTLLLQ